VIQITFLYVRLETIKTTRALTTEIPEDTLIKAADMLLVVVNVLKQLFTVAVTHSQGKFAYVQEHKYKVEMVGLMEIRNIDQ
jgi:hypothetical protein